MKLFRFITLLILLIITTSVFSQEYKDPISTYRSNYFITKPNQDAKFQFSIKGNLFYPFESGLYFGYTQIAWWNIYDNSSPFREFNHSPELFYNFESGNNLFNNCIISGVDYIQISPWWHKSNGRDGDNSRGINCYYGEVQFSYGDVYNFGLNLKGYGYYTKDKESQDYATYRGKVESELFLQLKSKNINYFDKERIYIKSGGNYSHRRGWIESGDFCKLSVI